MSSDGEWFHKLGISVSRNTTQQKKEWTINISNNLYESHESYAMWKSQHQNVTCCFSFVVQSLSPVWLSVTPQTAVLHYLPEFAQTHVHWAGDAIQPSHPLSPSSPPALNLSQHQGLFQWVSSLASGAQSIGVSASTSVLPMDTQDLSPLGWTGWISLQSRGLSRVFSNTTVQKHQFFSTQLSL